MLIYSMGVSVDGFIYDRDGAFDWSVPSEELFAFHLEKTRALGAHLCGRRVYETMRVWETDPSLQGTPDEAEFAAVWTDLAKIVFSRSLDTVEGNARLATASVAEEVARLQESTDRDIAIGGADLAGTAIELGLVDEFHLFRHPVVVGGGASYFPAVTADIELDLLETRTFNDRVVFERYRRVPAAP